MQWQKAGATNTQGDVDGTTQMPVVSFKAVALKLLEPCLLDKFLSAQHKQEGLTMMMITMAEHNDNDQQWH